MLGPRLALGSLLCALVLFGARPARACTCADAFGPVDSVAEASAVFRGRALGPAPPSLLDSLRSILPGTSPGPRHRIAFEVAEVWKGTLPSRVVVTTGPGSGGCGTEFDVGVQYVVFTRGDDHYTSICSGNFAVGKRSSAWLGPSQPPSSPDRPRATLWIALVTVVGLALGGYLWLAREKS